MNQSVLSDGRLPVIDVSALFEPDGDVVAVAREIGAACRGIGFFYVRGHGIGAGRIDDMFAMARRFFALPAEAKEALGIEAAGNNRGYVGIESENLDPAAPHDIKEAFNIGRESGPGDDAAPTPWPDLPGFRQLMTDFYAACQHLATTLHRAIAVDLGEQENYFARLVDRPAATLRLLHYPPLGPALAGGRLGAGVHTDYGNLTLLAQDEIGGLEVQTRTGAWISAAPLPGAFLCNIGDCLMRWSNDIYVSTPHRVVAPTTLDRYSMAYFFDPNPDALIACLSGCVTPDRPAAHAPIRFEACLKERLNSTYRRSDTIGG